MSDQENEIEIKCDDCERYLSFSPVFIKENGCSICAYCTEGKTQIAIRNKTYETLAKSQKFPCRFKTLGCEEILRWEEAKQHEEGCVYRNYNCFVDGCEWIGNLLIIKDHYEENHTEFLLNLPCVLQPDISKDTGIKYMTTIFDKLFIVDVKYSVSTSLLSYYICFVGKAEYASNYKYALEITSSLANFNIEKFVQPMSELHCPLKDNVINLNLNSLLSMGMIKKYEDCKFYLMVKLKIDFGKCQGKCALCKDCFEKKLVNDANLEVKCPVETPIDQNVKNCLQRHENFFCPIIKWCEKCRKNINVIPMIHYVEEHIPKDCVFNTNVLWFTNIAKLVVNEAVFSVYDAIFIIAFETVGFRLRKDIIFKCRILSNLPKNIINNYTCTFKLFNPNNKIMFGEQNMASNIISTKCDWSGEFTMIDSNFYNVEFKIMK